MGMRTEAGAVVPTCMHSSRQGQAGMRGDNSSSARAGAAVVCRRAGGQELYALFFNLPVITQSNSRPTSFFPTNSSSLQAGSM
jgi:hypothetical protein